MPDASVHLAPNAPWVLLAFFTAALAVLAVWAYRFAIPPLPVLAKRLLPLLRLLALAALLWLLAEPVLERAAGGAAKLVVLLDRSRSMALPTAAGGEARAAAADRAVSELQSAWRGPVEVIPFASRLGPDTLRAGQGGRTALGDALNELGFSPWGADARGVVVVSDGAINAGEDPEAAARSLGTPVHTLSVGDPGVLDRVVTEVESSVQAQVGRATPVRVRITTTEPRGTSIGVRLMDGTRELARSTLVAPGGGAETMVPFRVSPVRPGLAVWTAVIDSLEGELSTINNARQVAIQVAPGRIGVLILSDGLNWDLTFLRRAVAGDSTLEITTWSRDRDGWSSLGTSRAAAPLPRDLRRTAVLVLDGIAPVRLGAEFDRAVADFVRSGGGIMALGGALPGLGRYRAGRFGAEIGLSFADQPAPSSALPEPALEARELLAWDDDPARGVRAWRSAAPLSEVTPVAPSAGDRVLIRAMGDGVPLLMVRRVGRGQVLMVNGTGTWRWSLSGHDDLTAERGRRLWRGLVHWLAEPVQAEPLRVRPERWLSAGGESLRLFATLQDEAFRPVADGRVSGEVSGPHGFSQPIEFKPRSAGSYTSALDELSPGRYRISARATRGGRSLGSATTEFAVDRWSLEEASTAPDSAGLAAVARAGGGQSSDVSNVRSWARGLEAGGLARGRTISTRLREWPWVFAVIVGLLSVEWAWRRRRGLP